ncbi:MarR family winged helix-turn-helix transcriptional regulator [Yinghuangia soli]|uniref:MarR family transcriptional regulator n=1 Tax=Yinghuangia soli TaxID=2908204 RepID=A0AA41PUU6_9ACTN|nr:MarR family transcriptional regulator [Yinghuangia soli]MCF2526283.1 MarR family transcriptional regulator [Yinghuangia soli]
MSANAPDPPRRDLAAMIVPLGRHLMAAEMPVLRAHRTSMWAYVVLLGLGDAGDEPVRTQAALAREIGADKTRIIGVLDDLDARGLIRREPDPADRRARLLSLTAEGRRVRDSIRAGIREREDRLLARLSPADRRGFLNALDVLASLPPGAFADEDEGEAEGGAEGERVGAGEGDDEDGSADGGEGAPGV